MRALGWLRAPRAVAIAAVAAIALLIPASSLSVHNTGAFELDGNAVAANAAPPVGPADDWDRVCFQVTADSRCGTTTPATANAASWTGDVLQGETDPFAGSLNATLFTGGGSKDGRDVSLWAWKDGSGGLPDKDNLLHSFAARYSVPPTDAGLPPGATSCPNGTGGTGQPAFDPTKPCDVLFFGSDRYDNSGDAQQGLWLFQAPVSLGTTPDGGGFTFNGAHTNGDLLIISDFSNGGTKSTITLYKWNSSVNGNLELVASSTDANCANPGPADAGCGIVSPAGFTTAPWPFEDKSGFHNFLNGELYEGGINLSLFNLSNECFASTLSETRSSTSTEATLQDFVLSNFGECPSALVTTPKTGAGADIPPAGVSIGSGSVSVKDSAALSVIGTDNFTGTLSFHICGPTLGTCDTGGVAAGSSTVTANGTYTSDTVTITSAGRY